MNLNAIRNISCSLIALSFSALSYGKTPKNDNHSTRQYNSKQHEGLIGVNAAISVDNPADNSFHVYLPTALQGNERVWLKYELDGVQDYTAVSRSINDQFAAGGYLVKKRQGWALQKERLSTSWLKKGDNIIRFTLPEAAGYSYRIKNLSIEIAAPEAGEGSVIITQPTADYYDNKGYIRGFITGAGKSKATVTVNGKAARVWKGAFEAVVNRPADAKGNWQSLIEISYADGRKKTQVVRFDGEQKADYRFELEGKVMHTQKLLQQNQAAALTAGGAAIIIPKGALNAAATVSVTALRAVDLPAMDMGMVNVTRGAGFRFLPHGTRFTKAAQLSLEYDVTKIPQGYTEKDIRTYYFDEQKGHWVELSRDSVSVIAGKVYSRTLHFTDMINGVIKVPESPQVEAYNSNTMKGIKAASAGAAVNMIAPPQANSMGGAGISYPIELPAGRAGLQPQLAIGYNSGGGNSWLGIGWNIAVPSIAIDTRWGVPRFDAQNETETYSMGGTQLSPVAHRDELVARTSEKQFYPRVEGAFNKIIRHGNSPQTYWWEVTDKAGTKFFYGGDPATGVDQATTLSDASGNIAHWALKKTLDLHGNFISYQYTKVNDAGVANGSVLGIQLYLSKIAYTGFNGQEGRYTVLFKRDRELDGHTSRKDVSITASYGFKQVTADLLKKIEVQLDGKNIRHYELTYKEGAFYKTLLQSIRQYDAAGNFFNQHTFDYYNDVASGNTLVPLASAQSWTIGSDNVHGKMLTHINGFTDEASALSGTASKDLSAGVTVSVGFDANVSSKVNSVGGSFSYSTSQSRGMLAMVDINGDGLPDKLFLDAGSNTLYYRANQSGVSGKTSFGNKIAIGGINVFQKDKTQGYSVGLEAVAYGGLMAGANMGKSTTKTTIYFTEANGDQLMDIVKEGKVYFNHIDPATGAITFTPTSTGTPSPVFGGVTISQDLVDAAELAKERDEAINNNPLQDIVRMWQAPYSGTINVTAPLQLLPSSDPDRADAPADGVRASVQLKGIELWTENIAADDYSVHQPVGLNGLQVQKGDRIYFRIGSVENGSYDSVNWAPVIDYVGKDLQAVDANGKTLYHFDAAKEFVLSSAQTLTPPVSGQVTISGPFKKPVTTDDVMLVVLHTSSNGTDTLWKQTYAHDQAVATTILVPNVSVTNTDQYSFVVASQTNIDWPAIDWQPAMTFTSVNDPDVDLSVTPILARAVPKYTILPNMVQLSAPYAINLADTALHVVTVTPQLAINAPLFPMNAFTGNIIFSVKASGKLLNKISIPVQNGVIQTGNYALNVGVHDKDQLYIEYHVPNDTMAAAITTATAAISGAITAQVSAGVWSTVPKNGRQEDIIFGNFYRSWGQFAWNGNNGWETQPIDESLLRPSDQIQQKQGADPDALSRKNGDQIDPSQTYDPKQDRFIILIGNANEQRWSGYDQQVFVKGGNMSSSRQGADDVSLLQINTGGGTGSVAVDKVSKVTSFSFTAGASAGGVGGSASVSTSTSKTLTDFMDLNGDRYPDVVGEKRIQYTNARGGLSNRTVGSGDIHETSTNTTGISLTGSSYIPTAIFRTTPSGDVQVDAGNAQSNAGSGKFSVGGNAGVVSGTNKSTFSYLDMNGDGLADRVNQTSHLVALNLGYGFAAEEDWGFDQIQKGSSNSVSGGANLGFVKGSNSINIGFSLSRSDNQSSQSLQDMNGDGLPDLVTVGPNALQVRLNTGNGFSSDVINWRNAVGLNMSSSSTESGNLAFTVGFVIFPGVKLTINPSVNLGDGMSRELVKMQDVNGDGYPDYTTSSNDDNLTVSLSTIGRTNLLKSVNRPMGAFFTMDYQRMGNTYAMPNSMWALSLVKVYDGFAGDGPDTSLMTFDYADGFYDRDEREFYGFKKVTTSTHDAANNNAVYTIVTNNYSNDNYYMRGMQLSELLQDANGKKYSEKINTYELKDIFTGATLPASYKTNNAGAAFVALMRNDVRFYEGQPQAGKSTYMTYNYDTKGNITQFADFGDDGAADDIEAAVTYHNVPGKYIVGAPKSIIVTGSGTTYRRRESTIDTQTGDVTQIRQYLQDGSAAVTDLGYDAYGNLIKVTGASNAKGQRFQGNYEFDNVVHQYITKTSNSFGYSSQGVYDFRFGHLLKSIDLNNNSMTYQLDDLGRVTQITGPYELAAGVPYTIRFDYHPDAIIPWAHTAHYDPAHPGNDMETVTFTDGLGRLLQTKKDVSIFQGQGKADKEQMVVSGRIIYDGLGRQSTAYYPVLEDKGSESVFNNNFDNISPVIKTYDVMNRPLTTKLPDGSITQMTYGFGSDRAQQMQFSTKMQDANGKMTEEFKNIRGLVSARKNYTSKGDVWTSFTYDAMNQQLSLTDDINATTTLQYDMLGRSISRTHPDQGASQYTYDLAGNVIKMVTANLQKDSSAITYGYDFTRLTDIIYPKNPENNVHYTFGKTGDPFNRAGKIVVQEDATGAQENFYGPLGEVVKNVRTIVIPNFGQRTYVTQWSYDTWNRLTSIIYPDSEVVSYTYNLGGQVASMTGNRSGIPATYVQQLGYDKFEARVYEGYGNGTQTTHTFDPLRRRLQNLEVTNGNGRRIMDNVYTYDKENNILNVTNSAPVPSSNLMGGSSEYNYTYDDLYRLTNASGYYKGPNEQNRYGVAMEYNTVGSITRKIQTSDKSPGPGGNKWIPQKKTTYDFTYTYSASQPHAATHIGRQSYIYDANGNQTGWTNDQTGQRQKMTWDEENRLRSVSVNGQLNSYTYDANGDRVLKAQGSGQSVFVNGDINGSSGGVGNFTVYVNPYLVVKSGEYTNHYFVGGQRITTRLEHGWDHQVSAPDAGDTISFTRKEQRLVAGIGRDLEALQNNGNTNSANITGKDARGNSGNVMANNGNNNSNSNGGATNPGNHYAYGHNKKGNGNAADSATFLYFYHSDHLGSTSYVTDATGEVYQHLEYFPFGETFVEEHSNTNRTPYLFNGKELDEETGLYYYGQRYYDPRTSIWQSVDPKAGKMPGWSPYASNFDNPVKFLDPDGQQPTPAEAARMAAHVYGDKRDGILIGGWRVSKRDFGVLLDNSKVTGLRSQVYERDTKGGGKEYVYATAGTNDMQDVIADAVQPGGQSQQYHDAADIAKKISDELDEEGAELTFTGHSLGGGEAALNAILTDRSAITFNAAGVSDITKYKEGRWYTPLLSEENIDAYILKSDPLNYIQNLAPLLPDVNGNRHYLTPKDASSYYNGHSMDNVLKNFGIKTPEVFNIPKAEKK
jgi:RHS repeat-associated protein